LVGWVQAQFGRTCCRETLRTALHRLGLSGKKAKKLLGRADPRQRQAFGSAAK
jgi:transposase